MLNGSIVLKMTKSFWFYYRSEDNQGPLLDLDQRLFVSTPRLLENWQSQLIAMTIPTNPSNALQNSLIFISLVDIIYTWAEMQFEDIVKLWSSMVKNCARSVQNVNPNG